MNYTELIKQLSTSIVDTIKSILKTAPYDQSYKAKITEVVSGSKVKVLLNGQTHTATTGTFYNIDDYVLVCVPRNNWNNLYVV